MKINQAGLDLLKGFEKCRLTVYADQAGYKTVGWGQRVNLPLGSRVTQAEADSWLAASLDAFERVVDTAVTSGLNSNQYSALVCFVYNVGVGAFKGSKLLKFLNAGAFDSAALQFPRWCRAGGKVSLGLTRRRAAEQSLFTRTP
jgi:lysozyme